MKLFENKKLKGAVSIFLIIILIPMLLFSAVLIDGSRLNSAKAMAQEASDLAAVSALSAYNQELKDEFGLFAIDDNSKIEAIYKQSLENTLMAYGISGEEGYSERIWDILKTAVTGNKSYAGEKFLNLYDFSVDGASVAAKFPLAEKDVLESQMIEHAKFRGIYIMADRLSIFQELEGLQDEARKNAEAAEAMEERMGIDEKNAEADEALKELCEKIGELNKATADADQSFGAYLGSGLPLFLKKLRIENTDTEEELTEEEQQGLRELETRKTQMKSTADLTQEKAAEVLELAEVAKRSTEESTERLETYQKEYEEKEKDNETIASLTEDAGQNVKDYQEKYLPDIQKILDDETLNKLAEEKNLGSDTVKAADRAEEAAGRYQEEIQRMREEADTGDGAEEPVITEYLYEYLDGSGSTPDADEALDGGDPAKHYRAAIMLPRLPYMNFKLKDIYNPAAEAAAQEKTDKIDENFAKSQSEKQEEAERELAAGGAEKGEIDSGLYGQRPSKTYQSDAGKDNGNNFYNETGDLSAIKKILNGGNDSIFLKIGTAARDDVLELSYMFGTFKTRLTGVEKFSAEGMSEADKNSFYMPKWRYAHQSGEPDLRFAPKKERSTVLRSEIEYLIYGNRTDTANETAAYRSIWGERFINNMLAMYMEKTVIWPACEAAGAAMKAVPWVGFLPWQWIFLAVWASAETTIELNYLIDGGYRVPAFKTTQNLLLKEIPSADGEGLISNYGQSGVFVSYEDYLLLFLLFAGSDKRVMRSADLIEFNMKKNGQADFRMAEAYTTIHADTELSIRYLFGNVMPFQQTYEEGGYSGRIHFTNQLDLSY